MLDRLHLLQIEDGRGWQQFPEWARFIVSLGFEVGRHPLGDRRLIVALGVPTRVLAAAAGSAGVVGGCMDGDNQATNLRQHFQELIGSEPGTPVTLDHLGRQYSGEIQGFEVRDGEFWLRVRIQDAETGGETHFIRQTQSPRVRHAAAEPVNLPKQPHGITPVLRPGFLRSLLGHEGLQSASAATTLDCLIVGRAGPLKSELGSVKLAIRVQGERWEEGRLNDIARARQVLGSRRNYRSFILSSTSRLHPALSSARPKCVVFDGAMGFLKWRHHWRGSHWFVVLDKTDPRCPEGAAAVNSEYEGRNLGIAGDLSSLKRPPSVEISAFYGPCQ